MKLENMNQEFPKMPDAMRKMIEQEVEQQLQKKTDFLLEAVHVEHGIRGEESRKDAAGGNLCSEDNAGKRNRNGKGNYAANRRKPLCEADCQVAAGRNGADRGRKI